MKTYSLTRRILALVIAVSVASLLLNAMLLFNWLRPLGDELATRIATQVGTVAAALRATNRAERSAMAATFTSAGLPVSQVPPQATRVSPEGGELPVPPPLRAALRNALGDDVHVLITEPQPGHASLHFGLPIDRETWWIGFPAVKPTLVGTLLPMVGTIALVAIAAATALLVGVQLITRPMSQLAGEMLARRHALRPIKEPAAASHELREVIRSFNALVHALDLSDESRRNLLAGVSHDLRTPLARLRLRAEIECTEEVYQRMEPDFAALMRIVDQFLAYSQGQTDTAQGGMQSVCALVNQVAGQYRDTGRDVHVTRQDPVDLLLPDVSVQRMLCNLIDNGIAYGNGPIEMELRAAEGGVRLMVCDRGVGIAEQDLEHALTPFVRMADRESSVGHCGLGLAIVAQIATQLKGRVVHEPFDGRRWGIGIFVPAR